ncbi:MAG: 3-deoxy-7-phosphoheptulonate synthase [Planctomycetota bacterium]|nr:3-deoxy-7-phosphoheptulonate synthase [Planctomycetota bacterium]MCX8039489.1 3-deoxy-7-phosphoheptulonate synthase [Planctomycetota bacterium]MDW8373007.1 3-deoxy-7-phosphoheptulonate synthase [Planctomycetota bacterium]
MGPYRIDDIHVVSNKPLRSPAAVRRELPLASSAAALVAGTRARIRDILAGSDRRLLVIVGPCSIHDPLAALEYAQHVARWRQRFQDRLEIVMRVYFEKPRTTVGWKGLINDPHLDGSCDIDAGLLLARRLLSEIAAAGVPAASELLDPVTPQYLADFIAWCAIGARTTESQTHREMASGLSMPVGFKNGTDGSWQPAINAMLSARQPHHFMGIDLEGRISIVATAGNPDTHLVLRGGRQGPNYDASSVAAASAALRHAHLCQRVLIDCSHDNATKDWRRQPLVAAEVAAQVRTGSSPICGVMIESHLRAGRQDPAPRERLVYGLSITDPCVDVGTTETMLELLATAQSAAIAARAA